MKNIESSPELEILDNKVPTISTFGFKQKLSPPTSNEPLKCLNIDAAAVLHFMRFTPLINNNTAISENDFIDALNNSNEYLLLAILSTLYSSLLEKNKIFESYDECEKVLYPALRSRIEKVSGPFPHITSTVHITSWTPIEKSSVLLNLCDWIAEEVESVNEIADRSAPVGIDDDGNLFWFFGEAFGSYRLYKQTKTSWECVCTTSEELEAFATLYPHTPEPVILNKKGKKVQTAKPPVEYNSATFGTYLHTLLLPSLRRKEQTVLRAQSRIARTGIILDNLEYSDRPRRTTRPARYNYDEEETEILRGTRRSKRLHDDSEEEYNPDQNNDGPNFEFEENNSETEDINNNETIEIVESNSSKNDKIDEFVEIENDLNLMNEDVDEKNDNIVVVHSLNDMETVDLN